MYTIYVYIYRIHNWWSSTVFQRLVSLDLFQEEAAEVAEGSKATTGSTGSTGWDLRSEGISDYFHKKKCYGMIYITDFWWDDFWDKYYFSVKPCGCD